MMREDERVKIRQDLIREEREQKINKEKKKDKY